MSCSGTRPDLLAREIGMSAKALRGWLRREIPRDPADRGQPWHLTHGQVSSARVYFGGGQGAKTRRPRPRPAVSANSQAEHRDQDYVTSLVAKLLGEEPLREHRFSWLKGDTGSLLPVDAYYPSHELVLEYRERQHLADRPDSFPMWDRRMTASGVTRREQRAKYDLLREAEIPAHGLRLILVDADELAVDVRGRLLRAADIDRVALSRILMAEGASR